MTIYTALITPFKEDKLDVEGLLQLIEEQKKAAITGLVILGTTAETPTLREEEKERICQLAVEHAGELKIAIGCGASSTQTALENIQKAAAFGADYALVAPPAYNKPTPEGLLRHYFTLAEQGDLPLILYNIPHRAAVNLPVDLQLKLATHPKILGVKESSADLQQILDLLMRRPKNYFVLGGDDVAMIPFLSLGAEGVISVASNAFPSLIVEIVKTRSLSLMQEYWPLFTALCCETNPIPIKAALTLLGKPAGSPRLPLLPLSDKGRKRLLEAMEALCVA